MTRREQILEVYKHKNTGYVPCIYTDMDIFKSTAINERAEQGGKDWFGVDWTYVPEVLAPMVTPDTKVLTDITKWKEQVTFPDLDQYDWEKLAAEETASWDRQNKASYMMLINGIFERTHALMGFEDALCALYEEPEAYKELVDAITDYKVKVIQIIGKYYKPDILACHDDFSSEDRLFMSIDMWEEFFKAPTKRLIDAAHEQGIIYQQHCCGYVYPIFDQLVEMGIDAIEPLQVKNPLREMKDKYQDRVTFAGGYDVQNVYDRVGVTEEEIRRETKRVMDLMAPGGEVLLLFL